MGVPYGGQKRCEDQNTSLNFTDLPTVGLLRPLPWNTPVDQNGMFGMNPIR